MWDIGTRFIIKDNEETDEGTEIIYTIETIDEHQGDTWVGIKWKVSDTGMDDFYTENNVESLFTKGDWIII